MEAGAQVDAGWHGRIRATGGIGWQTFNIPGQRYWCYIKRAKPTITEEHCIQVIGSWLNIVRSFASIYSLHEPTGTGDHGEKQMSMMPQRIIITSFLPRGADNTCGANPGISTPFFHACQRSMA